MRKKIGKIKIESKKRAYRRQLSVRKKVSGSELRPRICPIRSNSNMSIQVIDDVSQKTIFCAQTYGKNAVAGAGATVEGVKVLGKTIAKFLQTKSISEAVYDRRGYKYTGVIASLADAIRENGIHI